MWWEHRCTLAVQMHKYAQFLWSVVYIQTTAFRVVLISEYVMMK